MKVCLFSSFSTSNRINSNVLLYLQELSRFNDIADLQWLSDHGIILVLVSNQGYDFGMYYKVIISNLIDWSLGDRLMLANDSCVLIGTLEMVMNWINSNNSDYLGLTSSFEHTFHVQSYFLVINKSCLSDVLGYLREHGIKNLYDEIDLTQFLLQRGYRIDSYIDSIVAVLPQNPQESALESGWVSVNNSDRARHLSTNNIDPRMLTILIDAQGFKILIRKNILIYFAKELIDLGFPLIKKKVMNWSFSESDKWLVLENGYDPSFDYLEYVTSRLIARIE